MTSLDVKPQPSRQLPQSIAFWSVGAILTLFFIASSVPSPLYQIYAQRWHFSSLTLTIVFGLYAIALLISLLVTGRLSDHLGRRPVIVAAVIVEIASMVFFLIANSVGALIVARVLSGLATGAAVGALSATLTELADGNERLASLAPVIGSLSSNFGLAAGGMSASVLVQYAPAPLRLVYWALLVALVISAALILATRETGQRRSGAVGSLKPVIDVPGPARAAFLKIIPAMLGLWALAGFYLSLGPGILSGIVGSSNLLWGGTVILVCWGCASVSGLATRKISGRTATLYGCAGLFIGLALTFIAISTSTAALFLIGAAVSGTGLGPTWLGAFRSVSSLAPVAQRAGTVAAIYILCYLAFSVPTIVAGIATTHFSVHTVSLVYSAVAAVLVGLGGLANVATPAVEQ